MENSIKDTLGFWVATALVSESSSCTSHTFMADWTPSQDSNTVDVLPKSVTRSLNGFIADWN